MKKMMILVLGLLLVSCSSFKKDKIKLDKDGRQLSFYHYEASRDIASGISSIKEVSPLKIIFKSSNHSVAEKELLGDIKKIYNINANSLDELELNHRSMMDDYFIKLLDDAVGLSGRFDDAIVDFVAKNKYASDLRSFFKSDAVSDLSKFSDSLKYLGDVDNTTKKLAIKYLEMADTRQKFSFEQTAKKLNDLKLRGDKKVKSLADTSFKLMINNRIQTGGKSALGPACDSVINSKLDLLLDWERIFLAHFSENGLKTFNSLSSTTFMKGASAREIAAQGDEAYKALKSGPDELASLKKAEREGTVLKGCKNSIGF